MFRSILLLIVLFVFAAPALAAETGHARVVETGVLRCGFTFWDGGISRNEKTNELEGFIVDLTNEIAKVGDVKIEWVGPIDWGQVGAELQSGKIDAMCAGMWQAGLKSKHMLFSEPFAYQGMEAFVRADDNRFNNNLAAINSADVKIVVVDNDNADYVAQALYPQAKRVSLPLGASDNDMLMHALTKKADVAFTAPILGKRFIKANAGKIKQAHPDHFVRVFGNTYVVGGDDFKLLHFIETVLAEIENAGFVDQLMQKYQADYPDMFIAKQKPYVTKNN